MTDVRQADLSDLVTPTGRNALDTVGSHDLQTQGRAAPRGGALGQLRVIGRWRPILMLLLYFSPTVLAGLYYGLIASDRFVSTAAFVVRTASKPSGDSGLGAFLKMAGLGRSEDDTYSVQSYLTSRDAVRQLQEKLPLAEMYARDGADFLSRFPSVIYGRSNEELFHYFNRMTSAVYNATTGVTTLEVQAFRPDDAYAVAVALLDLAEDLVNHLNARIHTDAVMATEEQVKQEEQRLTAAQIALTAFQNKATMIDPATSSVLVSTLVAKLQADLAQTQTRIADMLATAPNNPSLGALEKQADATRGQIAKENARISSSQDGLADQLGQYQRLMLEREFASKALGVANTALDNARADARRKQLYIERIVEPNLSDYATLPLRLWTTFTVFLVNILVLFIGWMLSSGVKEHVLSTR
jgi:capsular polysaccharide transport system permease protein